MPPLGAKISTYCSEYVGQVRWVKALVGPALLMLIVSNYLDIQCSYLSGQLAASTADRAYGFSVLRTYVFFFIVGYVFKYAVNLFNAQFIAISLRAGFRNFFAEYLAVKYPVFQAAGIGEAHYNITRRATALAEFLTILTMSLISNVFFFVLVLYTVSAQLTWHIKLRTLAALAVFLLASAAVQYLRARLRVRVNDGLQANSRKLYDILFNYERIVAYDTLDLEARHYWESMRDQTYYAVLYWVSYEIVGLVNSVAFIFLNVYLIAQFNKAATVTPDELRGFILVVTKLREKVFDVTRNIDELFTSFTNLDQSQLAGAALDEAPGLLPAASYRDCLEARDLAFSYGQRRVFTGVCCRIRRGEKVAITGNNGNGKSTFVKLLLGFDDYEGGLQLDGCEVAQISRRALRETISYVPQTPQLVDGTVMDNLVLGTGGVSAEHVVAMCQRFGLHAAFKALGYDRPVGERGKRLSGGQRQKICLMRAVLRDAPALVLDEATASMDARAELEVVETLRNNLPDRTILMIIHNMALLRCFDRVLFFDEHTLAGDGPFDELYAEHAGFRRFYDEATHGEERSALV